MDDFYLASEVKQKLTDIFGEECGCTFIEGDSVHKIKVYEIDRFKTYSADCAVAIEEGEFLKKQRYDYADLEHMVALLRAPGGCPWDAEQTHETIKKNFIEETYEVVEAINKKDRELLLEELGDVLLQVVFHTEMEREKGSFDFDDVADGICKKLIVRHPHVFGDVKAESSEQVLSNWDDIKRKTKHQKTTAQAMDSVPRELPALMRCVKLQSKGAKAGADLADSGEAVEYIEEKAQSLKNGVTEENIGELLFGAVAAARKNGIDPEEALTKASDEFLKKFSEKEKSGSKDFKGLYE